jgi:hypothetical protein
VAEALCFDRSSNPSYQCRARELRDTLAEKLNDLICTPGIVMEEFYGDGFDPGAFSDAELASYMGL